MPVLMRLRNNPQMRTLLQHPVLGALLYLKYDRARWFYYCNLLLFLVFTVLLTFFVLGADGREALGAWATSAAMYITLTAGLVLLTVRELLQLIIAGPLYFLSVENWIELSVLLLGYPLLWMKLALPTVRHLSAWIMVAAWLEVAMSFGRTPTLAPYMTKMERIACSFGKLIFLFFGLVMAFAIAFYLVFSSVNSFSTLSFSIPRVIAMATGEFDYVSLSETMMADANETMMAHANGVTSGHVLSGVLLFMSFIFLIVIVLMNLLTSLAVDDTQAVSRQAAATAADNTIVLLGQLEHFFFMSYLPSSLRRAGEGAFAGIIERLRRRLLLFHDDGAHTTRHLKFFPNKHDQQNTYRDMVHACSRGTCDEEASICFSWLTPQGCIGEQQSCELPGKMRKELLILALKPQEDQLDQIQSDINKLNVNFLKLSDKLDNLFDL